MSSSPAEPLAGAPRGAPDRPLRVAVVGVSTDPLACGVRDHATLLAAALGEQGIACTLHWLTREQDSLAGSRRELNAWAWRLGRELEQERPDAVLLHYSVFTYSFRGVPLFLPDVLRAARATGAPLVAILHEYAYPWGRSGARGLVWALSQRAYLRELARASAALVLTTDFRAEQLATRRWLPRRRLAVAPVFSNLPAPRERRPGGPAGASHATLGLFGYAAEATESGLVLDALRLLREERPEVGLRLLGAPGPDSPAGRAWSAEAAARGVGEAVSFTGMLSAQELSDALAGCTALVFADPTGPTSRKTTLAASLASGSPVVAIDGPHRWQALAQAGAARIVAPEAHALADAAGDLLGDPAARDELGGRGREFARREMSVARAAEVVGGLLRELVALGA